MNETWTWRPLGELFEIGAGKTMSAAARNGADKTPFLRTSNVLWDEIDLSSVDEMSIPEHELPAKLLRPGDLLVCEGGEIGRAAIWGGEVEPMSFQNHVHRLRPTIEEVVPRFYAYFLQSGFTQLGIYEGAGNKTTIPNLSRSRLAGLDIPQPPLAEQQAISCVLSRVRDAIKVQDRGLATAQALKRAAMHALFTCGLRAETQKETEIGPVPESWELKLISDHFAVVSGGTPSRRVQEFWKDGTIPWVKTTEVDYCVIKKTEEYITRVGLEQSAAKVLPPGTLLLAMYGQGVTRGKVAILGIEATCNQACAAISPNDGAIDSKYLYHFLLFRYESIRQLAHGGQQQNLNLEMVRNLPIPIPPDKDLQSEVVDILDAIDHKIDLHRSKRAVLEELFKTLLHKLMTGEVRVGELDLSQAYGESTCLRK